MVRTAAALLVLPSGPCQCIYRTGVVLTTHPVIVGSFSSGVTVHLGQTCQLKAVLPLCRVGRVRDGARPTLAHWGGGCLHSAVPLVPGGEISVGLPAAWHQAIVALLVALPATVR